MADYLEIARRALAKMPASIAEQSASKPFPRCPRCLSHDLYRENGIGNFECLSCELQNITEEVARRLQ